MVFGDWGKGVNAKVDFRLQYMDWFVQCTFRLQWLYVHGVVCGVESIHRTYIIFLSHD